MMNNRSYAVVIEVVVKFQTTIPGRGSTINVVPVTLAQ